MDIQRCAAVLDFPPMGARDAQNKPVSFDVDYCNDFGKALGVKVEIVDTPFPDRIPAFASGRVDVAVAFTSDTLERAKTVGFSISYFAFKMVVLTKDGLGLDAYDKLKERKVGSVSGGLAAYCFRCQCLTGQGNRTRVTRLNAVDHNLRRLVYYSRNRVTGPSKKVAAQIRSILAASRRNNEPVGITGARMFNAGCFAQVIEGEREVW